jgi:hypothetical protein
VDKSDNSKAERELTPEDAERRAREVAWRMLMTPKSKEKPVKLPRQRKRVVSLSQRKGITC